MRMWMLRGEVAYAMVGADGDADVHPTSSCMPWREQSAQGASFLVYMRGHPVGQQLLWWQNQHQNQSPHSAAA